MKKLVVLCFAVIGFALSSAAVFAAPSYTSTIEPISSALNRSHVAKLANGGPATDIIIINYTDFPIYVTSPKNDFVPPHNSDRIKSPDYAGYSMVAIQDQYGREFFRRGDISPLDTLSVRIASNGNYSVDVDH